MRKPMILNWTLIILVLVGLSVVIRGRVGFNAQDPQYYSGSGPFFDLKTHLNGAILCEGVIYGPLGRVESRFVANMFGNWSDTTGTLDEFFTYSTGTTQSRQWRLTLGQGGKFSAVADDIIGTAEGVVSGASVRMKYRIRLPEEAGGHTLSVTDWLYLTDNGTIINRSQMRKFGFKVAELVATMRPAPAQAAAQAAE